MAERATIARPYAKAAFEYAQGAHALGEWSSALQAATAVVSDERVAVLIKNPQLLPEDLAGLVADCSGAGPDSPIRNFFGVLAENRRLTLLPEILAHYETMRAAAENTVDVHVVSAIPLDAAQKDKLAAAIGSRLKRSIRMENTVDPSLLGGAIVRAGDMVIDGSLKGKLKRLETELAG